MRNSYKSKRGWDLADYKYNKGVKAGEGDCSCEWTQSKGRAMVTASPGVDGVRDKLEQAWNKR